MNEAARMKRDPTGQKRQTASGYAAEIRPWGRYSEEQIQEAVAYALARGTILPDEPEAAEGSDGAPNATMTEGSEMPDQKEQLIQEVVLRLFDLAGIQGLDRVTSLSALVTQIEQEVRADRRREYD